MLHSDIMWLSVKMMFGERHVGVREQDRQSSGERHAMQRKTQVQMCDATAHLTNRRNNKGAASGERGRGKEHQSEKS